MGLQQQTVIHVRAAQIHQDAALGGLLGRITEIRELLEQDLLGCTGEARGAVCRQQPLGDLDGILHVLL